MILLHAVVLCSTLFALVSSTPLNIQDSQSQEVLASLSPPDKPEYRNGETPPTENTLGWIDPRLNGGRLLDVRPQLSPLTTPPHSSLVHNTQIW